MAEADIEAAKIIVERIASHLDDLAVRYLAYAGSDDNWANRAAEEAKARDAVRAILADHAKQAETIGSLENELRETGGFLDEMRRQLTIAQDERDGLRGVMEWIANHRNDGLTDGSAATRTCLDEMVNLAAAALSSLPASPRGYGVADLESLFDRIRALPRHHPGTEEYAVGCAAIDMIRMLAASPAPPVSPEVEGLVIAAREVWEIGETYRLEDDEREAFAELDKALEPFSALVPYENEPVAPPGEGEG